jgi:hypothetical protein
MTNEEMLDKLAEELEPLVKMVLSNYETPTSIDGVRAIISPAVLRAATNLINRGEVKLDDQWKMKVADD